MSDYTLTLADLLKRVGMAYECASGAQAWAVVATRRAVLGTDSERDAHTCRVAADACLYAADDAANRARLSRVCTFSSKRGQAHAEAALRSIDMAFDESMKARMSAERERVAQLRATP